MKITLCALSTLGVAGALVGAGLYWPTGFVEPGVPSPSWRPTRGELAKLLGVGPGAESDGRSERLADHLTQRYRRHSMAVRVIIRPQRIELRCGANIPHWQMSRIAVQVQQDVSAILGRFHELEMYETYIGLPKRHVASLRASTDGKPVLTFHEPAAPSVPAGEHP